MRKVRIWKDEGQRSSGRTTRMIHAICQMLRTKPEASILVIGLTGRLTDILRTELDAECAKQRHLGREFSTERVVFQSLTQMTDGALRAVRFDEVFPDHTVLEELASHRLRELLT